MSGVCCAALTMPLFFIPCGAQLPPNIKRMFGAGRCSSAAAQVYDPKDSPPPRGILDWGAVKGRFKWEILFIFGGGYMVAHGTVESGLAAVIASGFAAIGTGPFVFLLLTVTIICFVTEVVSNMAAVAIFGPILVAAAASQGFSPVGILLTVTLASSFAFMLPMAGGPNMTVFSTGKVSVRFMAAHGFGLNLISIVIGTAYFYFLVPSLLGDYNTLQLSAETMGELAVSEGHTFGFHQKAQFDCSIVTTGGSAGEGSRCQFPFVHAGISYNECATVSLPGQSIKPWCYTAHDEAAAITSGPPMTPCGVERDWCTENGHAPDSCGCGVCGSFGGCSAISCPPSLEGGQSKMYGNHELVRCPASAAQAGPAGWEGSPYGKCVDTCEKQPMRRHLFANIGSPEAICMDGTSSGYYYAPATEQPEIYVLFLQGGGWCYDEVSCAKRCGTQPRTLQQARSGLV
jgi:sodium-dependent dicarboxylate transporter 2/3/5